MGTERIDILIAEFLKRHPEASLTKKWDATKKEWSCCISVVQADGKTLKFFGRSGRGSHLAEYEVFVKTKQYLGGR